MTSIPKPTPAPPYRLIRAQKLLTEAIAGIASYKGPSADDADLHQAIYAIDRAKLIIGKRIDKDLPR